MCARAHTHTDTHTHTHTHSSFYLIVYYPLMTRYRHATFLTTQTNSSLTETVEHWSWSLKMNEFNAWPVCKEHSLPKYLLDAFPVLDSDKRILFPGHQSSVVGCGVTGIIPVSRATFPCSANCSHTVLDQTSSCCRLMFSCCSFALTPRLTTDRKKCLRSDTDLSLIPPNKQTKWINTSCIVSKESRVEEEKKKK